MEKRSFAWDENPHSGMLRLSLPVNFSSNVETVWSDVPHVRNGSHVLLVAAQDCRDDFFDNFACEPESHLKAHGGLAGLFSAAHETIWPMMTDCIHDRDDTASSADWSRADEKQCFVRRGLREVSRTGTGGNSFSDLYMGHGS